MSQERRNQGGYLLGIARPTVRSGMLAGALRERRVVNASTERGSSRAEDPIVNASSSLEEELLRMLARQARRIPVPVFLAALMIAALASDYLPVWILGAWLSLVVAMLAIRWHVLGRLPARTELSAARRLQLAIALSAINGVIHGLSIGFFPFLPEFERALQSMVMIGLCAGAVGTTVGYMPALLTYLLPTLGPLSVLWAVSPGIAKVGWIENSTAALIALLIVLLVALGRDAYRLFRESFEIRLQQAELNRQLAAALEQAEAANRAKTRFLASASHDLRQPIHTLSLFGAALSMRPLEESSREIVQQMNTALQILASQLDALLDVSKLDAGVVRVNPAQVELRPFLERIRKEFEPAARSKGLALSLACDAEGVAQTDPMLLERIVRNLVDNAIKYTDAGRVELALARAPGGFVVRVEDSGRGIDAAEQARVFEEFYQTANPERDRTKGLGLGLAIVKRLADLLQLRLEMDSLPGEGTRFRLFLAAAADTAQVGAHAAAPEPASIAAHVLVVDDEEAIRVATKTLLESLGCRATLADGTERAVAAARSARPDVVLADFRLRGEDNGIAAVHAVRALYPDLPAILLSGDIAPDRLREAEAAGIAMLHKPVPADMLKRAIAEAVGA
jgi:signal transduction histidine kinase